MTGRVPPRNLPTLTEVVRADSAEVASHHAIEPVAQPIAAPAPRPVVVDRDALAREVFWRVRPQLEAELRNVAMELFEAQFNALLPSLHLQIEEVVREAIAQALPDTDSYL